MAVTRNTYTGNGSTVLYSFTFPYLENTDVKVSVNGVVTTAYTFANATTIQFNTAPANGAAIAIYRQTDDASLAAAFYPGSAIRSQDLNDNFTQNLYVTQESNRDATDAIGFGQQAISTANGAVTTANAATATANTASSNASAAVSTANTANTNASAAVSTANTASSNATTAVNTANAATATANSAAADAATAISTANSAVSTANSAVSTANAATTTAGNAVSTANSAVSTANTASTNASNAVTTANAASTTAAGAVTTANSAVSTATGAVSTANTALSTANAAASAVANAILYDTVANVAAIPASPANNDAVEVVNSTGIESFTPLAGKPAGFVGDSGLSVRIVYTTTGSTWNWIQYFPNDPETRYGDAITTLQTDLNQAETDILALDSTKLNATTAASTYLSQSSASSTYLTQSNAASTYQPQSGMSSYLTTSAAGTTYAPIASPTFTGTPTGPSFSVTGSTVPTNGVYLPSANNVAISTNSTGRLFVDASGNVGLGISPSTKFHVYQTGSTQAGLVETNQSASVINFKSTGQSSGQPQIGCAASDLILNTNGSERARLDSSGRLGLGTSSPSTPLHVASPSSSAGINTVATFATPNNANTTSGGAILLGGFYGDGSGSRISATGNPQLSGAHDLWLQTRTTAGTLTNGLLIDATGRVGIGTTTPDQPMTLNAANGYPVMSFQNNGTTVGDIGFNVGLGMVLSGRSTNPILFYTNSSERGRWDSSGRFLVGTSTAPSVGQGQYAPLVVQGYIGNSTGSAVVSLQRGQAAGSFNSGDVLGEISFCSSNGSTFAYIRGQADGASGTNDYPGALTFSVTSDGSASPTEALRITNDRTFVYNQADPVYKTANATLTIAELKNGIIINTTTANVVLTLPTGANCDGGFSSPYNNMAFEWSAIPTNGYGSITIASNTGHTIVGDSAVYQSRATRFVTRRTGANTWVTYRIAG